MDRPKFGPIDAHILSLENVMLRQHVKRLEEYCNELEKQRDEAAAAVADAPEQ